MYYSQIAQDRWVHQLLGDKPGYFVELGACDGIRYSNTLFFEQTLGWDGICIEPNDIFFKELSKHRRTNICNDLVYSEGDIDLEFSLCGEVSGVIDENIGPFTTRANIVTKKSVTLESVLDRFKAPRVIDYLSLDVEGQEYNILRTFPFDKYKFRCMTVEHNAPHIGDVQQMKIRTLLELNGYTYVRGNDDVHNWGHGSIDDFYINASCT